MAENRFIIQRVVEQRTVRQTLLFLTMLLCGCQPKAQPPPAPLETKREAEAERLSLVSVPSGARARLSSGESCVTPCSVRKSADSTFSVTFEKENYRSQTVRVTNNLELLRKFNARRGMEIDEEALDRIGTVKLQPNPVSVELEPEWSK